VLTLTLLLGCHWAFLQSVAWVGMVVQFSQEAPLSEALLKAFDGKHPCRVCKFVAEGKKSEKKQEARKPVTRLDFWFVAGQPALEPPTQVPPIGSQPSTYADRTEAPPTPPPRAA